MSAVGSSTSRTVIPRWHMSSTFASTDEASALNPLERHVEFESWFDQSLRDWRANQGVGFLADLFSTAIVERRDDFLPELARAVLEAGDAFPRSLQGIAERIIYPAINDGVPEAAFSLDIVGTREAQGRRIGRLRKQVKEFPRDAFSWHDLAYQYNLIGESGKADRAMLAALRVSDSHRVIARGASRFYSQHKDDDRALSVLRRSQGFSKDPWLLSAHLAVSQVCGRESSHLNTAKRVLEEIGPRIQTSELGMAVATHEMLHGKMRKAKAAARSAGHHVTENALAQAVWLSPRMNIDLVSEEDIAGARQGYEARCWESFYRGDWRQSLVHVLEWLRFEPYSIAASLQGSFVATTLLREFELGVEIAQFGLSANPDTWMLRNNLVVALVQTGRLDEAMQEFSKLEALDHKKRDVAVWNATQGLMKYRLGEVEAARSLYEEALTELVQRRDRSGQIIHALYQSLEEAKAGHTDESRRIVKKVYDSLKLRDSEKDLRTLLQLEILSSTKKEGGD